MGVYIGVGHLLLGNCQIRLGAEDGRRDTLSIQNSLFDDGEVEELSQIR